VPGWVWNTREAAWEVGFAALEKYAEREGHARVSDTYWEGEYNLGQWVRVQRRTREGLSQERISRLESLIGWIWRTYNV